MVTLVAGAVAVGIVSVCAIPFGCFISRKMRKKAPAEAAYALDFQDERRAPNPGPLLNQVDAMDEPECLIEEISSRPNSRRSPRVEIRVFVSNSDTRSTNVASQGYITASRVSDSTSSRSGVPAQAIEARRRLSLQNLASGPAADVQSQARSYSLPMAAVRMCEPVNQGSQNTDTTTRLEITISGPCSQSVAQFGEFKDDVPDASTPKSKSNSVGNSQNQESETQQSSFWRKAPCKKRGQPKVFKTTRDIEIITVEVIPRAEVNERSNLQPELAIEAGEKGICASRGSRDSKLEDAAGSAKKNESACDRGKWRLPGRFFDTLRESTSFATL